MRIVAQKLVKAIEDIFNKEIAYANCKSKEHLSQQNIVSYDESIVINCLHKLLEYNIWRLCHKTFVYEFHEYRKSLSLPADPSSSKAFDLYVELIDENLIEHWFSKYDCLRKMVTQSAKNSCYYVEEICRNFNNDIISLCADLFVDKGSKLLTISPLDSDPHNGSKVVICFEFEPSRKLIYKPRSLKLDSIVNNIFCNILKFDALPLMSPVPPTVNKDGYGWQGFIDRTPIEKMEARDAYYNLGLCASVFSCLGATDLHDENIIFNGTYPYFVDLETSLRPTFYRRCNVLHELMEDILFRSVVATSIPPAKLSTIPHQVLIGAINTPYPQETIEEIFTIINPNTDAIDIAKEKIQITQSSSPIALVDDKTLDPLPFQSHFLDGYMNGYMKILSKREQIRFILSDVECLVRVIVRPTVQYAHILDACLFPENLIDDAAINKVLHYLKPTKLIKDTEMANNILMEELNSLKNGDIPYFCVKANDTRMCSEDYISDSVFDVSPANNAIHSLEKLSEEKMTLEIQLIAEGYSEIRIHEAKHMGIENLGNQSPFFFQVLRQVTKDNPYPFVDMIHALAITTKTDNAETGWLGGVYGDFPISYDSTPFISMHDAGGILFLYEHLTEDKGAQNWNRYDNLFEQAKRGLTSLYGALSAQLDSAPQSIISGTSSLDYIFNHRKDRLEKTEQVLSCVQSEDSSFGDIYTGSMGICLLLAVFPDTPQHILEMIDGIFKTEGTTFEFSDDGIAHGNLGAMWGQFRLSYAQNNVEKCVYLFRKVMQLSFTNSAGWYNGNAGLLMVLAEMASILNINLPLYAVAKKATILPKNGLIDLSVCHGAAGVLQSLLFTYAASGDHWYLSLANQYWESVLKLAIKNGFYTGENNRDYLLGYFLGWSGIADSALLLQICNNGDSSWFPLNLSSNTYQKILFREKPHALLSSN